MAKEMSFLKAIDSMGSITTPNFIMIQFNRD